MGSRSATLVCLQNAPHAGIRRTNRLLDECTIQDCHIVRNRIEVDGILEWQQYCSLRKFLLSISNNSILTNIHLDECLTESCHDCKEQEKDYCKIRKPSHGSQLSPELSTVRLLRSSLLLPPLASPLSGRHLLHDP